MTDIKKLLPELSVIRAVMMTSRREAEILEALKAMREDTIEECAQLVERECYDHDEAVRLAALIRSLKDKP